MKNTMYIVFGVFALALFGITILNPSYAEEGLIIDDALDVVVGQITSGLGNFEKREEEKLIQPVEENKGKDDIESGIIPVEEIEEGEDSQDLDDVDDSEGVEVNMDEIGDDKEQKDEYNERIEGYIEEIEDNKEQGSGNNREESKIGYNNVNEGNESEVSSGDKNTNPDAIEMNGELQDLFKIEIYFETFDTTDSEYSEVINITGTDGNIIQTFEQKFNDLDLYFIKSDGNTGHYTIMDRNMGATEVYNKNRNTWNSPNFESYGYQYQWGNNYGIIPCRQTTKSACTNFLGGQSSISSRVNVSNDYKPSKFAYGKFVNGNENWMLGSIIDNNIWGGAGDKLNNNGGGTPKDRQGPCPSDYYIPSIYDWLTLTHNWVESTADPNDGNQFAYDLLLPPSGYRNYSKQAYRQGVYGNYSSSSPSSTSNKVRLMFFAIGEVRDGEEYVATAQPIRCFKKEINNKITIEADGGTGAVIAIDGNKISALGIPKKAGYIFSGWYTDPGFATNTEKRVGDILNQNSTLYAKWVCDTENGYSEDENHGCAQAYYTLTINYVYSKGGNVSSSYVAQILSGTTYNVLSPSVDNYQTTDTTISGIMLGENKTITVIYTPITDDNHNDIADQEETSDFHKLRIHYWNTHNGEVYPDYELSIVKGASYSVVSSGKTYYTINKPVVEGVMGDDDITVTVIYSAGNDDNSNGVADEEEYKYLLTINYVYSGGGEAFETVTGEYLSGILYSITSPVITNYIASQTKVEGIMLGESKTITVTYTPVNDRNNYSGGGGRKKTLHSSNSETHGSADVKSDVLSNPEITRNPEVGQVVAIDGGTQKTVAIKNTEIVAIVRNTTYSSSAKFTREENDAYSFAKSNGLTTTESIEQAKMNTELTRIQMAKILSNFAINVLGEEPDTEKGIIKFDDVTNKMDKQYDNAITKAYQLGIMGQNVKNNEFRPNDEVTRAEFASVLSRLLYNTEEGEYKGTGKYYIPHIAKLYNEGIINKADPKIKEKRGYVMTMLKRTVE